MTDQTGRTPDERLPARRPPSEPAPVDRFTAPRTAHVNELTPERAAKIVEQSASARLVALIASLIVVLFTIAYYFYEVGLPFKLSVARTNQQRDLQQVTAVERGYNLFQANCARCHGPNGKGTGEGYSAPPLNDNAKLYVHLSPQYIANVLREGGRLVCGNAKSAMPIWSNENGGPLNYIQIQNLIAFIRAPSNLEYVIRDPNTLEPEIGADGKEKTFPGWRDPDYKPDAAATAVPDCWSGTAGGSQAPTETLPPDAQIVEVTAESLAFNVTDLTVDAGKTWGIDFTQKDSGVGGHNVEIRTEDGTSLFKGEVLLEPGEATYTVPALDAGTYTFICSIHPIPTMTGTLTVK
jgi:mono/diheme cytochrome c family protein/plastocyanin